MSHPIFHTPADPRTEAVRRRIFNAVPAATFQMQKLFETVDIRLSEKIPSAAILSGRQPRMLFNPSFIDEYCRTDEHLMMLVFHELYHLILGHTRLFQRSTLIRNLAFDAVINAMLCRQFPHQVYTSFFMSINDWTSFPARLLRPPPGWPAMDAVWKLPRDEQSLFEMLYGADEKNLTYHDVFKLLIKRLIACSACIGIQSLDDHEACPADSDSETVGDPDAHPSDSDARLLGDHSGRDGAGLDEASVLEDERMKQTIRRMIEDWAPPPFKIAGRDSGCETIRKALSSAEQPGERFSRELHRLLRRAGLGTTPRTAHRRPLWRERQTATTSVIPQARDRHVSAYQTLYGHDPVFYQVDTPLRRLTLTPHQVTHVYLDVSGSMTAEVPYLVAALDGPHSRGECRCFAFSTVVDEIHPRQLKTQPVRKTFGTDIKCVMDHLLGIPVARRPRHVVILTDGYVGPMALLHTTALATGRIRLFVGLIGSNSSGSSLQAHAHWIGALPPVTI